MSVAGLRASPDAPGRSSSGSPTESRGLVTALAVAIGALAVFNAFWRLGVADWKTDEAWDGRLAWLAVDAGDWGQENGHPVFVRWFLGAGQLLLGQDRFGIRAPVALASVAAVALLYLLGRRLQGRTAGLIAAGLWAVLPRALVLGDDTVGVLRGDRFGYLEPFMVVAVLGATWTGWNWILRNQFRDAAATGLLVGFAVAFKPTAIVILVPIIGTAIWRHRSVRPILTTAAGMGALSVVVLALSYAPVGSDGPDHLWNLFEYQLDHARTGHNLVVDGTLTDQQPRWSHVAYQWRGMGPAASIGLLIGIIGAWTGRRSKAVAYITAIWLSFLAFHLVSSVALPHYYLLWAPFSVLLAAMGLAELAQRPKAAARGALVVAAALLVGAGLIATWRTATLEGGDYARMTAELDAAGVDPAVVRFQGEAVEQYFPDSVVGQIGFTDEAESFDLLVLDARDVPMLPDDALERAREGAAAAGLTAHQIGRLEVWYR